MNGVKVQNNRGTKMRQNVGLFKGQHGVLKWRQIPESFQEKFQKALPKLDLSNNRYTFHYEIREKRSVNNNFNIHTNDDGYPGHVQTFIYYYEIEGVNTSLNFYRTELGSPSWLCGVRFGKQKKCHRVPIKKGTIITFGNQAHKPNTKATDGAKNIKRYTLAIFVTDNPYDASKSIRGTRVVPSNA